MNYLFSKRIDIFGMYLPFTLLWISFLFTPDFILFKFFPDWAWLIFVLGFDVSHVWSTLFRTYFSKKEFNNHKTFLIVGPVLLFLIAFCIAFLSVNWFWRVLAYVAVFHFIKQQYGFLALYRVRKGKQLQRRNRVEDKLLIYAATGIPILLWHLSPTNTLAWFVDGDFFNLHLNQNLYQLLTIVLSSSFLIYLGYWIFINVKRKMLGLGMLFWVLFTVLNWFGAIVFLKSDYIFTLTNVVAHGLPYFLLIVFFKSKEEKKEGVFGRVFLKWTSIVLFSILILAFLEEYFWDTLINHEKEGLFSAILPYTTFSLESSSTKALGIALLALPQLWHYCVDGLIWKANNKNPSLKQIFKS